MMTQKKSRILYTYYPENIFTVKETDYLLSLSRLSEAELLEIGISENEVYKIKNNGYSGVLLELAKETNSQLINKGFNERDIPF